MSIVRAQPQDRLRAFIEREAHAVGFDAVGFTTPDAVPHTAGRLAEFVALGRHGTMEWMAETAERRGTPKGLWPEVRSIIMLGMNYGPDRDPLELLEQKDRAAISVYARHRDYHDIIKGKLKQVASKIASRAGADVKVFVDTAPVMEKPLAAAAGLGWQGKHTNLVSREFGSWLFLGAIFTTAELDPDLPVRDYCGSCRACQDICPTNAFPAPYQIDARRCISYLTIEHKGPIDHELRPLMGNRIYGCDDCLAICPWNKFAQATAEMKLKARDNLQAPELSEFLTFDDPTFRTFFSASPVKRIGRDRFVRNVLIAVGNSGMRSFIPACRELVHDESPIVRGMAVWALSRLMDDGEFATLAHELRGGEADPEVQDEWAQGLEK
ncbi:epoxyqueuosine reductase [Nitratireductor aestuarii]|uniref:Epoxyqueuosine reductase n=1 Tax=Nitratireductor aestuarii TaxID=1735103 RepID=A0A916RIM4_9HYPH|nr:tRNA epoxyqueuosine(34) reductase QueG [Nitratireductor aestuarii]GGA57851.1 epoxyqueuosine reductase [Nitratireductor aestuarii]